MEDDNQMPQPGSGTKRKGQLEVISSGYGAKGAAVLAVRIQCLWLTQTDRHHQLVSSHDLAFSCQTFLVPSCCPDLVLQSPSEAVSQEESLYFV